MSQIHKDIAKLYKSPPPDCLFDPSAAEFDTCTTTSHHSSNNGSALSSSFGTTLYFYMLGPESTAYAGGAWKLKLVVPREYPRVAPKAWFVSRIFHPNVEPVSGEVCVDTLKRDWHEGVDLSHVMLTIRCLLIQPNPESSLNEEAGKLLLEDYSQFERMARVMTKVHSIPRAEVLKQFDLEEKDLVKCGDDNTNGNGNDKQALRQSQCEDQAHSAAENQVPTHIDSDSDIIMIQQDGKSVNGASGGPKSVNGLKESGEGISKKKTKPKSTASKKKSGLKRL